MALSQPRQIFGVHSVSPYSRTTGVPYGILKVLGGSSLSIEGELVESMGGSNKYPWAVESGSNKVELNVKIKEYPDFVFELFLGKAPTSNGAETSGNVSTLTNKYGTLVQASTGIASVSVIASTGPANLKFGKYLVRAVSSTTVDIYCLSDIDFLRGTDGSYSTDGLKIAAAQTISSGADTNISTYGFKLTGGSGTIGLTTGDTATFEVRPIATASIGASIGVAGDVNPEFGAVVMAQKRATGEMFEMDLVRCLGSGMAIPLEEFKWSETELKIMGFYDSSLDKVMTIRQVNPSSVA